MDSPAMPYTAFSTASRDTSTTRDGSQRTETKGTGTMDTVELSREVELRRTRFFLNRLAYLRSHMAGGEQALLDALLKGQTPEWWEHIDAAIDRQD